MHKFSNYLKSCMKNNLRWILKFYIKKSYSGDLNTIKILKEHLDDFLKKISTEKKTARKRKVKKSRNAIFKKGDCLVFKLSDGDSFTCNESHILCLKYNA